MVGGFMAGMPLRGGIAKGPLTVKTSSLGNTFYGLGLTKAYLLESQQEWSGCIIEHGIVEPILGNFSETSRFLNENYLIEQYEVPLKNGIHEEYWTLNWPLLLVRNKDEIKAMFEEKGKRSEHPSVITKIENTVDFYTTIVDKHGEYRDYIIVNSKKSSEDLLIFLEILAHLGYARPKYDVRPSFRSKPNTVFLDEVEQKIYDVKIKDKNTFKTLKDKAYNSTIYRSEGKWLLELFTKINNLPQ